MLEYGYMRNREGQLSRLWATIHLSFSGVQPIRLNKSPGGSAAFNNQLSFIAGYAEYYTCTGSARLWYIHLGRSICLRGHLIANRSGMGVYGSAEQAVPSDTNGGGSLRARNTVALTRYHWMMVRLLDVAWHCAEIALTQVRMRMIRYPTCSTLNGRMIGYQILLPLKPIHWEHHPRPTRCFRGSLVVIEMLEVRGTTQIHCKRSCLFRLVRTK